MPALALLPAAAKAQSAWLTRWLSKAIPALYFAFLATTVQADPLIVGNNAAFGGGPIQTYDFATGALVNSFVPTGAANGSNGRGVAVFGNTIYYTELSFPFGPTDSIHVAPFNGGAGGADIKTLPNPSPGNGIADLDVANGVLYVTTGYQPSGSANALQVWGLNLSTGTVLRGPVTISAPAVTGSDGFTILPNGNFLINSGDASCVYNQFSPTTGAVISGTTITLPPGVCTGVTAGGPYLYFQTNFNSFTKTDLTGMVLATQSVPGNKVEDITIPVPKLNLKWPLPGTFSTANINPDSKFGSDWIKSCPADGPIEKHNGIDYHADKGTKVYASADGVVRKKTNATGDGFAYAIVIEHTDPKIGKYTTVSWHLDPQVKERDMVTKGITLIGTVADIAKESNGKYSNHFHFGIRMAPFDEFVSTTGGLPQKPCRIKGHLYPAFPDYFIDPADNNLVSFQ